MLRRRSTRRESARMMRHKRRSGAEDPDSAALGAADVDDGVTQEGRGSSESRSPNGGALRPPFGVCVLPPMPNNAAAGGAKLKHVLAPQQKTIVHNNFKNNGER